MQFYDLTQTSLAKSGSSVVEEYIPIWVSDGTNAYTGDGNSYEAFLLDGSLGFTSAPTSGGQGSIYTLNSNWSPTQLFALESTIWTQGATCYVSMKDLTSGLNITSSQISTTSGTATVVRSGKFTLTPGHSYGLCIWTSIVNSYAHIIDASLVVFGQ